MSENSDIFPEFTSTCSNRFPKSCLPKIPAKRKLDSPSNSPQKHSARSTAVFDQVALHNGWLDLASPSSEFDFLVQTHSQPQIPDCPIPAPASPTNPSINGNHPRLTAPIQANQRINARPPRITPPNRANRRINASLSNMLDLLDNPGPDFEARQRLKSYLLTVSPKVLSGHVAKLFDFLSTGTEEAESTVAEKNPIALLNEFFMPNGDAFLAWPAAVDVSGGRPPLKWAQDVVVCGKTFSAVAGTKKAAKTAVAGEAVCWLAGVLKEEYSVPIVKLENQPDILPVGALSEAIKNRLRQNRRSEDTSDASFANKIADLVHERFRELGERFEVDDAYRKYAVLAGVVQSSPRGMECVCLATGTKCISPDNLSLTGRTVKDCHAEILALRCFKQYLYAQIDLWTRNQSLPPTQKDDLDCIFTQNPLTRRLRLRPGITFSLYISSAPCGDSRVFSLSDHEAGFDQHPQRVCRGQLRLKIEAEMGGVKIPAAHSGAQTWDGLQGGERLLVMSCSDKLLKRAILGVQGALLSVFLEPIYLRAVVVGHLFNADHLSRALYGRLGVHEEWQKKISDLGFSRTAPLFLKSTIGEKRILAPKHTISLAWVTDGTSEEFELLDAIKGKTLAGKISCLSKATLIQGVLAQWSSLEPLLPFLPALRPNSPSETPTYHDVKNLAHPYRKAREIFSDWVKSAKLGVWVSKIPEEEEFLAANQRDEQLAA